MIIFLSGLQGISNSYYEASMLDGANKWQQFRYITLPMLKPTTFFVFVMAVISSFQVFDQVMLMTKGRTGTFLIRSRTLSVSECIPCTSSLAMHARSHICCSLSLWVLPCLTCVWKRA